MKAREALAALAGAHAAGQKLRCMGCNRRRRWPPGKLFVAAYMPDDPTHHPIAYCACAACINDPQRRERLMRWVETRSRAAAEGEA